MSKTIAQIDAAEAQIRLVQQDVDYTVREYPIEVVVSLYTTGEPDGKNEIFVPDYQRDLVWDDPRQSKFIESLLVGLPIPYLFVADVGNEDEELSGRLEIVDGTQRIRTLARYTNDELILEGLKKLTSLNGFKFSELPSSRQRRFNRITLRMIELTERADEETRRDMFDRINTGSVRLNDMESRRGRTLGRFMELVSELAKEDRFRTLAPVSEAAEKRFEREELVARYFAFMENYLIFGTAGVGKVVSEFVDAYASEMNNKMDAEPIGGPIEQSLRESWNAMLTFVERYFGRFSKATSSHSTPRVRFEAIAVGTGLALKENANPPGAQKINQWLNEKDFMRATTSDAANNRARVLNRINFVKDRLLAE